MSPKSVLERALVTLLLSLAWQSDVALQVSRDSPDEQVKKSFKKVVLKIHPDKPRGCKESTQKLNDAYKAWQDTPTGTPGRKPTEANVGMVLVRGGAGKKARQDYRIQSELVLLTYQNFPGTRPLETHSAVIRVHLVFKTMLDPSPHRILAKFLSTRVLEPVDQIWALICFITLYV